MSSSPTSKGDSEILPTTAIIGGDAYLISPFQDNGVPDAPVVASPIGFKMIIERKLPRR